jgi:hypothetical protein
METGTLEALTIYLCENEHEGDDHMRELNLAITVSPQGLEPIEEVEWKSIDERELTREYLARYGSEGPSVQELYALFGRKDLSAKPGLPKGPYYAMSSDATEAIKQFMS